jgi:hypothetical protein
MLMNHFITIKKPSVSGLFIKFIQKSCELNLKPFVDLVSVNVTVLSNTFMKFTINVNYLHLSNFLFHLEYS